ncbi:hypothetical protein GQ53DRAFT_743230 [Thozetella sp. PMI_491]|nr:hypothetical protein GQ53DRAFT_743230 [Thozetella sp. PMI_491]
MADEVAKAITESTELVRQSMNKLDAALGSLTALVFGHTDATPFLLAIATKFASVKGPLMQLREALEHPCVQHFEAVQFDLKGCMAWCQLLSERLLALARAAVMGNDGESYFSFMDKEPLQDEDDLMATEVDVDNDLDLLRKDLNRCIEACDCKLPPKKHSPSLRSIPRTLIGRVNKCKDGARELLMGSRQMGLSLFRKAGIVEGLCYIQPVWVVTPRCIEHRQALAEASRRSAVIDELLQSDARRQCTSCMLPVCGSSEMQMMILEQFIARIPNEETESDPQTRTIIRQHIIGRVRRLMSTLALDDHSDLDESVRAVALEVYNACGEAKGSAFDGRLVDYLKSLWSNPVVRRACVDAELGRCEGYGDLIVQAAERAFKQGYRPTIRDCHRFAVARERAFHLGSFHADGLSINFLNCERRNRKHLDLFQDFPGMLFIVDLADYNRPTPGGDGTSHLQEMILLFDSYINSSLFSHTPVLLLLANLNRFKEELSTTPLSTHFPDFRADGNRHEAVKHVVHMFTTHNRTQRQVYIHAGELTDSNTFEFIIAGLKDALLKRCSAPQLAGESDLQLGSRGLGLHLAPPKHTRFASL